MLCCGTVYYPVLGDSSFESVDKLVNYNHSTQQMKVTKHCFPVVLFLSLYEVVLTFEAVFD